MTRRGLLFVLLFALALGANAYLFRFRARAQDLSLYEQDLADLRDVLATRKPKPVARPGSTGDVAGVGVRLAHLVHACGLREVASGEVSRGRTKAAGLSWTVRGPYDRLVVFLERVASDAPNATVSKVDVRVEEDGQLLAVLEIELA